MMLVLNIPGLALAVATSTWTNYQSTFVIAQKPCSPSPARITLPTVAGKRADVTVAVLICALSSAILDLALRVKRLVRLVSAIVVRR